MLTARPLPTIYENEISNDVSLSFLNACQYNRFSTVRHYVEQCQLSDDDMSTGFFYACGSGHLHIAQYLWCHKQLDQDDATAFLLAAHHGHVELLKWLISVYLVDPYVSDFHIIKHLNTNFEAACLIYFVNPRSNLKQYFEHLHIIDTDNLIEAYRKLQI